MKINLQIKPLSVNLAWQGKRFKTPAYKRYERDVLLMLPKAEITNFDKLKITYGFSNKASDIDNPTKMILDILQKKYGINDRDIEYLVLQKVIVKKGQEFIEIWFYD